MLDWLKSLLKQPEPAGPPQRLRAFTASDRPISQEGVAPDGGGWRIESREKRTVRLFEISDPGIERCILTYRVQMKTENVQEGTYLEMWCRFSGRGEFFSRGFHHKVKGTRGWASFETPFYLKQGQRPDLLKLNLVVEGPGTVWLKDVEMLRTPLR